MTLREICSPINFKNKENVSKVIYYTHLTAKQSCDSLGSTVSDLDTFYLRLCGVLKEFFQLFCHFCGLGQVT